MRIDVEGKAVGEALARLRNDLGLTQKEVASKVPIDQSRLSRLEKGEAESAPDVERVLGALTGLGSAAADGLRQFLARTWRYVEPPSYWNPERPTLEAAEETLQRIGEFLGEEELPWPLRRQLERRQGDLIRVASYLSGLRHNLAFIGDIGVGKSTAISHLFDLMTPIRAGEQQSNTPVLETGAGGTTICEVQVKLGPQYGISLVPMEGSELMELVSDFCAVKWATARKERNGRSETPQVAREAERAIRNMAGLTRKKSKKDGKQVYEDPIHGLVADCQTEDDLRARVLQRMRLASRTRTEIWHEGGNEPSPLQWSRDTFRAVNNGRLQDVPLPKSISLMVPDFGRSLGEFEVTVVDTKGVVDIAVREDLDARLKDARTSVVLCCRFNDAPGTSAKILLRHMKQTSSERFENGKLAILGLPRSGEAREMKDDEGEPAFTDEEGYEFKRMQVEGELAADEMPDVPVFLLNVEGDEVAEVRMAIYAQISRMRQTAARQVADLCAGALDIIENQETVAVTSAIEAVNSRLKMFLAGNNNLGAREKHAYEQVLGTVGSVRYASTLWAATRRHGEYYGLSMIHQIGIGAAKDAQLRSRDWFAKIEGQVNALKEDDDLVLARRSIELVKSVAETGRRAYLEAAQRNAMEIYREPLSQDRLWLRCIEEWGAGAGYTDRIAGHLRNWFETERPDLKEVLENRLHALWQRLVIMPLMDLAGEGAREGSQRAA